MDHNIPLWFHIWSILPYVPRCPQKVCYPLYLIPLWPVIPHSVIPGSLHPLKAVILSGTECKLWKWVPQPENKKAMNEPLIDITLVWKYIGTGRRWLPGHGHKIQHLSILCPGYVQPVSRYRICPIPVPARSKLCQPSADFPWGWTEIGPQDPEFVKVLSKKSMKLKFFLLDTLWTDVGLVKTVIRGLILGFWK